MDRELINDVESRVCAIIITCTMEKLKNLRIGPWHVRSMKQYWGWKSRGFRIRVLTNDYCGIVASVQICSWEYSRMHRGCCFAKNIYETLNSRYHSLYPRLRISPSLSDTLILIVHHRSAWYSVLGERRLERHSIQESSYIYHSKQRRVDWVIKWKYK